MIHTKLLTQKL